MKLPNGDLAYVERIKITDYLLSHTQPDGRGKAAFFTRFGFAADRWEELAAALRVVDTQNEVASEAASPYGVRYYTTSLSGWPDSAPSRGLVRGGADGYSSTCNGTLCLKLESLMIAEHDRVVLTANLPDTGNYRWRHPNGGPCL